MTTTNGNNTPGDDRLLTAAVAHPEATALNPATLNAALKAGVRTAVLAEISSQITARAKEIAEEALEEFLTDEVIAEMRETAEEAAEEALAPQEEQEAEEERKLYFKTPREFVEGYVAIVYAREVSKPGLEGQIRWCPQWHEHPEAEARFKALHRAFEHLRHGDDVEMSTFWRDHLDHHMGKLFDPEGPFKYCSVAKGHNAGGREVTELPLHADPAASADEPFEVLESGLVKLNEPARRGEIVWEFE
ncbi:DUF4913 domain-containing protein [Nocardia wallacei]|uniref:DUF4913 domain-containing protein n=1 Tax=Nocardia wallacei TaxID=480035 RepID=UPI0024543A53|nr:DUF4913 domain-containing protein [Nocardia wallacei]